jgi:hypothetical protein
LDPDGSDDAVPTPGMLEPSVHQKGCIKRNTFVFWLDISVGGNAHRFNLSHLLPRGRAPIPKPARKIIEVRVVGSKIAS